MSEEMDDLVEVKVTRTKRPTSKVRRQRRKAYRKNKSKAKRKAKQRRKKASFKRRMKRLRKIRKRMHIRPGSRRRVRLASDDRTANLSEGTMGLKVGDKVKVSGGSGVDSDKTGTVVDKSHVKVDGKGKPTNIQGAYKPVDWSKEVAVKLDDGTLITMFKNRLTQENISEGRFGNDFYHTKMLESYFETMLWATPDEGDDQGGEPLDKNYGIEDIDQSAINKSKKDIESFVEKAGDLLDGLDDEQVGHDFFLTRCGHGAGFWDGDYEKEIGEKLTEISEKFGNIDPYVGDDGKIYIMGSESEAVSEESGNIDVTFTSGIRKIEIKNVANLEVAKEKLKETEPDAWDDKSWNWKWTTKTSKGESMKEDDEDPWMDQEVFTVSKTFDVIDPGGEAIKDGEYEESGFEWEDQKMSANDIKNEIEHHLGYFQNFQDGAQHQALYASDAETDYQNGTETMYAIHIDGSKEDMDKLNALIKKDFKKESHVKGESMKEDQMKKTDEYEIVEHGLQSSSYFQGHGISNSDWEECATGVGSNPKEALDDALEQLASNGWDISDALDKEANAYPETPVVGTSLSLTGKVQNNEIVQVDESSDGSATLIGKFYHHSGRGSQPQEVKEGSNLEVDGDDFTFTWVGAYGKEDVVEAFEEACSDKGITSPQPMTDKISDELSWMDMSEHYYYVSVDVKSGGDQEALESVQDQEIAKLQESINEFKTALEPSINVHYSESFKACSRISKHLIEAYEKVIKSPVQKTEEKFDEFNMELPGFAPDTRGYQLTESFAEMLNVKPPKTEIQEAKDRQPENDIEAAKLVIQDLKSLSEQSIKLAEAASKGLLDEHEAKSFLTKSQKYLDGAVEALSEENSPVEQEIYSLSSGTIAGLTGLKKSAVVERFQVALANWAHKHNSKDWKDAFRSYMESLGVTLDRTGNADHQEFKEKLGHTIGEDAADGDDGASDSDVEQYLEQWRDNDNYTDYNLMLDRGLLDLAADFVVGAGAMENDDSSEGKAIKEMVKNYPKDQKKKDIDHLLTNVEIWIDPKSNEHDFVPCGDVDYFTRQSEMKKSGREFDRGFDDEGQEYKTSQLREDEEDDDVIKPEEDDMYFSSTGPLGSHTSVSVDGKHLGTFKSEEEAEKVAKAWIKKSNVCPNIWTVSDHGNTEPRALEVDESAIKEAFVVTDKVAQAFAAGQSKKVGNTSTDGKTFFLHGNAIVKKEDGGIWISNAGWPTATTRERINGVLGALGVNASVFQKAGNQVLVNSKGQKKIWNGAWTKVSGDKGPTDESTKVVSEAKLTFGETKIVDAFVDSIPNAVKYVCIPSQNKLDVYFDNVHATEYDLESVLTAGKDQHGKGHAKKSKSKPGKTNGGETVESSYKNGNLKEAKKSIDDILKIAKQFEKSGKGFFSRVGKDMFINVSGKSGNDMDQWPNAMKIAADIGFQASEPQPDPMSGNLVVRVRNVYTNESKAETVESSDDKPKGTVRIKHDVWGVMTPDGKFFMLNHQDAGEQLLGKTVTFDIDSDDGADVISINEAGEVTELIANFGTEQPVGAGDIAELRDTSGDDDGDDDEGGETFKVDWLKNPITDKQFDEIHDFYAKSFRKAIVRWFDEKGGEGFVIMDEGPLKGFEVKVHGSAFGGDSNFGQDTAFKVKANIGGKGGTPVLVQLLVDTTFLQVNKMKLAGAGESEQRDINHPGSGSVDEHKDDNIADAVKVIINIEPLYNEVKRLIDGGANGREFDEFIDDHKETLAKHKIDVDALNGSDLLTALIPCVDESVTEDKEKWHIIDWAGNICFGGKKFASFDDAEEFLSEKLGDSYETDRCEYYAIPVKGSRDKNFIDPKDPRGGKVATESSKKSANVMEDLESQLGIKPLKVERVSKKYF